MQRPAAGRSRVIASLWIGAVLIAICALYWWGYLGPPEPGPQHHQAEQTCQYAEAAKGHAQASKQAPATIVCFEHNANGGAAEAGGGDNGPPKAAVPLSRYVARHIVSEPITLFTAILALLTWRLIAVGRDQHQAAMEATDVAKVNAGIASLNAKTSADSITTIERAYVYPVISAVGPMNEIIQRARVYYLDEVEKDDTPVPETADLTFHLKNFGKTPAVLKSTFACFGVLPVGYRIGLSIPESILGAGEDTSALTKTMDEGLTPKQARGIGVYTNSLAFEGEVTFDDIWGIEHTTEFLFTWDKEIAKMVLREIRAKVPEKD